MLLGLSKIIDCPGAFLPFSTSVDLSDLRYGLSKPVSDRSWQKEPCAIPPGF